MNCSKWPAVVVLSGLVCACQLVKKNADSTSTDASYPDKIAAHVLIEAHTFLYNQNVAGKAQAVDTKVDCAQGGTVNITGTAHEDAVTKITSVDLKYDSAACHLVLTDHDITMTGIVTEKGTFDSTTISVSNNSVSTGSVSRTFKSDLPIVTSGTDKSNSRTTSLVLNCVIAINQSGKRISGTICARSFGY